MPNWRDEYLASIEAADATDPANSLLIAACESTFLLCRAQLELFPY
jgi:hypothetical protein